MDTTKIADEINRRSPPLLWRCRDDRRRHSARHDRFCGGTTRQDRAKRLPAIKPGTNTSFAPLKQIDAGVLNVGYAEAGPADGPPVILLHGWPYDIHSFVDVAPLLASAGYRVIVPYLRGYGTTRFLSNDTVRNGQPSALAVDIDRLDGCSQDREGDPRRLRLGSANRQHRRGALAGARARPRSP